MVMKKYTLNYMDNFVKWDYLSFHILRKKCEIVSVFLIDINSST